MIKLTEKQKRELEAQGYIYDLMDNVVQNKIRYFDPKTNDWTAPLPADPPRLRYYLAKGFLLYNPAEASKKGIKKDFNDNIPKTEEMPQKSDYSAKEGHSNGYLVCDICGFKTRSHRGFSMHKVKSHKEVR